MATAGVKVRVWRAGDRLVVTLPAEEVERYGLREGQEVLLEVRPVEAPAEAGDARPLAPDLQKVADRILSDERHLAVLRYLADR